MKKQAIHKNRRRITDVIPFTPEVKIKSVASLVFIFFKVRQKHDRLFAALMISLLPLSKCKKLPATRVVFFIFKTLMKASFLAFLKIKKRLNRRFLHSSAETERFELSIQFPVYKLSRLAP